MNEKPVRYESKMKGLINFYTLEDANIKEGILVILYHESI